MDPFHFILIISYSKFWFFLSYPWAYYSWTYIKQKRNFFYKIIWYSNNLGKFNMCYLDPFQDPDPPKLSGSGWIWIHNTVNLDGYEYNFLPDTLEENRALLPHPYFWNMKMFEADHPTGTQDFCSDLHRLHFHHQIRERVYHRCVINLEV